MQELEAGEVRSSDKDRVQGGTFLPLIPHFSIIIVCLCVGLPPYRSYVAMLYR